MLAGPDEPRIWLTHHVRGSAVFGSPARSLAHLFCGNSELIMVIVDPTLPLAASALARRCPFLNFHGSRNLNGGEQGRFSKLESCSAAASTACLADRSETRPGGRHVRPVHFAGVLGRVHRPGLSHTDSLKKSEHGQFKKSARLFGHRRAQNYVLSSFKSN